jgi:fermentation-respiration switch protein FrsA (DUF1100 family)
MKLVALFLVAAFALSGAVILVGIRLSRPVQTAIGDPPEALAAETITLPSASGAVLRGWFSYGESGGGAVVLMHGVRADRRAMTRRALVLKRHGFSVLLFDLQAHGESIGRLITFGRLEALDAMSAVAYARARLPAERIGIIGVSLGGAAALLGPQPLPVDAMVLESVFPDIHRALTDRLATRIGPVLAQVAALPFEWLMPPILGVRMADLRPIDRIAAVRAPLLIASGTADTYTPIAEARDLFARAPEPKQFWPVEGAAHVDLEQYDPDAYWSRVLPFLTANLRAN